MSIKSPPQWMLAKLLKRNIVLIKVTETEIEDDLYGQAEESKSTYSIKAEIQDITESDIMYLPEGALKVGDAIGYFLDYYIVSGNTIVVDVDDLIIDRGHSYRVQTILQPSQGDNNVYRRASLRRLEGGAQ